MSTKVKKPSLLLRFLHAIIRVSLRIYFRSIKVSGKKNVPTRGPLVIVANHPASVLDPMLLASVVGRNIGFVTRGDLATKKFWAWLYSKLNLIAVYRSHETPELMHKNKEVFRNCFNHLSQEGSIIIFPEGQTTTERRLRPVKTGSARIALGAEAENNFELGVKILPVGLNYSDPHNFRSRAFLNIGEPISLKEYQEQYRTDERGTVKNLTANIKSRLEELSLVIDEEYDGLVDGVEQLFKKSLVKEYVNTPKERIDFELTKDITHAIEIVEDKEPGKVNEMAGRINTYLESLSKKKLEDRHVYPHLNLANGMPDVALIYKTLKAIVLTCAGFPIWLYGVINSYLPYRIPGWVAQMLTKREEHFGSIYLIIGMATFPLFYGIQTAIVAWLTGNMWIALAYLVSLPITGLIAYRYNMSVPNTMKFLKVIALSITDRKTISDLIKQRVLILVELNKAKKLYLSTITSND